MKKKEKMNTRNEIERKRNIRRPFIKWDSDEEDVGFIMKEEYLHPIEIIFLELIKSHVTRIYEPIPSEMDDMFWDIELLVSFTSSLSYTSDFSWDWHITFRQENEFHSYNMEAIMAFLLECEEDWDEMFIKDNTLRRYKVDKQPRYPECNIFNYIKEYYHSRFKYILIEWTAQQNVIMPK